MKMLTIICLMAALIGHAAEVSKLSTKAFDIKDKDGNVKLRLVTTYRGEEKIIREIQRADTNGTFVVTSRSYLVAGNLTMIESDEHKSGSLDTVAVFGKGTNDLEVFSRQADGSVKPLSTTEINSYKDQVGKLYNMFDPSESVLNQNGSAISNRVQKAGPVMKQQP